MTISEIARELGRLGGLSRARRLSNHRRTEIARLGARAREESLRLARAIRNNFDYVSAMQRLHPPKQVRSELMFLGTLPGVYDGEKQDQDRTTATGFHRRGR